MLKGPCDQCVVLACCKKPCEKLIQFNKSLNLITHFIAIFPAIGECLILVHICKLFGFAAGLGLYGLLFIITLAFTNALNLADIGSEHVNILLIIFLLFLVPIFFLSLVAKTIIGKFLGKFPNEFTKKDGGSFKFKWNLNRLFRIGRATQ